MLIQQKNVKSKIFVFEGIDNVGKTTIINSVKKILEEKYNLVCEIIPFPGSGLNTLGGLVYDVHHNTQKYFSYELNPTSLQLLHVASHIDNIVTKILPAIAENKIILLDRFWWSTLAYGLGNKIPEELLKDIIKPELYYWNDIEINKYFVIERKNKNSDYPIEVTQKICETYKELMNKTSNAYEIVNDQTVEETTELILNYIINNKGELL